jgi:hypothetical protein
MINIIKNYESNKKLKSHLNNLLHNEFTQYTALVNAICDKNTINKIDNITTFDFSFNVNNTNKLKIEMLITKFYWQNLTITYKQKRY